MTGCFLERARQQGTTTNRLSPRPTYVCATASLLSVGSALLLGQKDGGVSQREVSGEGTFSAC